VRYSPDDSILATFEMNGRVCVWNVASLDDPMLNWEMMHKDEHKGVSKGDVGEILGADSADRSLCPTWYCSGKIWPCRGRLNSNFAVRRKKTVTTG